MCRTALGRLEGAAGLEPAVVRVYGLSIKIRRELGDEHRRKFPSQPANPALPYVPVFPGCQRLYLTDCLITKTPLPITIPRVRLRGSYPCSVPSSLCAWSYIGGNEGHRTTIFSMSRTYIERMADLNGVPEPDGHSHVCRSFPAAIVFVPFWGLH